MTLLIDLNKESMPRDVRIAKSMLEYLSEPDFSGRPQTIAFTMYEEDCELMLEICKDSEWTSWKKWEHMRSTLSAVASKLSNWGYLERFECRHNQEALEYGEPTHWFAYKLKYKYRARFNPAAWPNYKSEWSPAKEMAFTLLRVFDYESTNQ